MISDLPDQMLLEILSWLPTKEVVATMLLSKRWKFLWKQVPKLDYDFSQHDGKNFSEFVSTSLQLQEGQVFTSFKLSVSPYCDTRDVRNWIDCAVYRFVRELEIDLSAAQNPMITTLPKSLYTCKTLTCLKLKALVLEDIPEEHPVCLSSLQDLYLSVSIHLSVDKFLGKLLAGAPNLKKQVLQGCMYDNQFIDYMATYNLLKGFTVCCSEWSPGDGDDCYFAELEQLCMCTCTFGWWNLLIIFLLHSPKLRYLQLSKLKSHAPPLFSWDLQISISRIPQCLSSTLQTFEWRDYTDTHFDKAVASFLLKHSTRLTKAKISTAGPIEKLRIRNDLSNMSRGSTACQLIFR